MRRPARRAHFIVGRGWTPEAHVLSYRGSEDDRILRDERNRAPHIARVAMADVRAVEQDASGIGIVEAQDEREHR